MSLTIHTHDLIKSYRNRTVVNHVSVEVKQGEIVGLLGPNGAGKTTTFYMVVGLIRPDEGKVFLNDLDITNQPMYKRAQMGLGYLPQEASVFRKLTVEDNIKAILEMTKLSRKEQKDKLESLLDEFGLQHVRPTAWPSRASGRAGPHPRRRAPRTPRARCTRRANVLPRGSVRAGWDAPRVSLPRSRCWW